MASLNLIPLGGVVDDDDENSEEESDEEDDSAPAKSEVDANEVDGSKRPQALRDLYAIISKLEAPGTFACGATLPSMYPGLHINGYGDVSLPLRDQDAQQIISLCQRAPFGRGEQTIVDTTVRNTWQLNPSEVQITNKEFVQEINTLVSNTISVELGLGTSSAIGAQLYKVLLYEPGGFFVPHRDTEKQVGMFGSLVVTLPSTFSGGALVVHHQDMSHTFTVDNPSFTMSYVAFFADCKHEIQPVTSGHRLALVYNLISFSSGPVPSPASTETVHEAAKCLNKWKQSRPNSKFVFVLNHEYTPSGLSFQVLKNRDRAVVQLLQEALKDMPDMELTLALLNFTKYGGGSSKYDISYKDGRAKIGTLINSSGEKFDIDIPIELTDFYPADAFDNCDYDDSWNETTGNEGASSALFYHKAVVLVWPRANWMDLICGSKLKDAVAHLTRQISKCSLMEERDSPDWLHCKQLAELIIDKHGDMDLNAKLLMALVKIGDFELIKKYFPKLGPNHGMRRDRDIGARHFYPALDECIGQFGWDAMCPYLDYMFYVLEYGESDFLNHYKKSIEVRDPNTHAWIQYYLRKYANAKLNKTGYYRRLEDYEAQDLIRLAFVVDQTLLPAIFAGVNSGLKNVDRELIPFVKKLKERTPGIVHVNEYVTLVYTCMNVLQQRISTALSTHETWAFTTWCPCEPRCVDCAQIKNFMLSPTDTEFRLKGLTGVHDHLQKELKKNFKDQLTFEKEGPKYPYTLVICKLMRECDVARKKAEEDTAVWNQLQDLLVEKDLDERATKRQKIAHDVLDDPLDSLLVFD